MKKFLSLLLLIPLTAIATEHGGRAMQSKTSAQQTSEHGGKAMEKKEQSGGKAADTASEHGGKPLAKKASEHAGSPVE